MFYNWKFRQWKRLADWLESKKPICKHWFHVISPASAGRKEIEVSECRWCKQLTSELYVLGKTFNESMNVPGYGPVEACPVTEDPPIEPKRSEPTITLKNGERIYEPRSNLAQTNRHARKSPKAQKPTRRSREPRA